MESVLEQPKYIFLINRIYEQYFFKILHHQNIEGSRHIFVVPMTYIAHTFDIYLTWKHQQINFH